MKAAALAQVTVDLGFGRQRSLLELIEAWGAHVLRFLAEQRTDGSAEMTWGIHDYVAALTIRDQVEEELASVDEQQGQPAVLRAIDQLYRSFTVEDDERLLTPLLPQRGLQRWWWRRLPDGGPVTDEARRLWSSPGGNVPLL